MRCELDIGKARQILPPSILLEYEVIGDHQHSLYPEEHAYIATAVAGRRKEFASGRYCARRALVKLARRHCSILMGPKREPIWPDGISGSITHDGNFALAAVAFTKDIPLMGIDLALKTPLQSALVGMICTKEEIANASTFAGGDDPFKLIFSLKEAFYKCAFPMVRKVFDFSDVSIELAPDEGVAQVVPRGAAIIPVRNKEFRARYCFSGNYIFSAVWCV